jgi:hypothetical protein
VRRRLLDIDMRGGKDDAQRESDGEENRQVDDEHHRHQAPGVAAHGAPRRAPAHGKALRRRRPHQREAHHGQRQHEARQRDGGDEQARCVIGRGRRGAGEREGDGGPGGGQRENHRIEYEPHPGDEKHAARRRGGDRHLQQRLVPAHGEGVEAEQRRHDADDIGDPGGRRRGIGRHGPERFDEAGRQLRRQHDEERQPAELERAPEAAEDQPVGGRGDLADAYFDRRSCALRRRHQPCPPAGGGRSLRSRSRRRKGG